MSVRRWPGLAAGVVALTIAWEAAAHDPKQAAAPPPGSLPIVFGGPFSLVDHDGVARTERDFAGRFLLVYFGYATCPDICPTGLSAIAAALEALGPSGDRVQPIFISVDPKRDTPERLKAFVAGFHPRLIGLTGNESAVRAAARAYRVHRAKVAVPDAADGYLVSHGSLTYLMDPNGRFVTLFPHDTDADVTAKTLAKYVR